MKAIKYIIRMVYFFLVAVPIAFMLLCAIELSSINLIKREVEQR